MPRRSPTLSAEERGVRAASGIVEETPVSQSRLTWMRRRLVPKLGAAIVFGWLALVLVLAVAAPILPIDGLSGDNEHISSGPVAGHLLGTDQMGRDTLARLIMGAHNTVLVVLLSVALAILIGVTSGVLAGFLGGFVEWVVGIITDSILAFPALVLVMALVAIRGGSLRVLIIGLGIAMAPTFARLARAGTLSVRQRDFVLASVVLGTRTPRVLLRDVLPNIWPAILAYSFVVMGVLTIAEGSLSYLGFGIPAPKPSWGSMVAEGKATLLISPHNVLIPACALFLTVLCLNIAGEIMQRRQDILKTAVAL